MNLLEIVATLVAILAAVVTAYLGIYKFINERRKTKVHLEVIPLSVLERNGITIISWTKDTFNSDELFGIKIVNLSSFDITVDEVGFLLSEGNKMKPIRNIELLPKKLGSRESVTIDCDLEGDNPIPLSDVSLIKEAYAKTACGHTATGKSKALDELIEYGKLVAKNNLNKRL